MKTWVDSRWFERILEIMPGLAAWLTILAPFILAFLAPIALGIFVIVYSFYWLVKSLNISRHLVSGFIRMRRNMQTDWSGLLEKTEDIRELEAEWFKKYEKSKKVYDREDLYFIQNLHGDQKLVKDWKKVEQVVIVAVSKERLDILEPTIKALSRVKYPLDKLSVVIAAESAYRSETEKDLKALKKEYGHLFKEFVWYWHVRAEGEVIGKGPNIAFAGKMYWKEHEGKLIPENVLVTNLDADHIVHPNYFSRLTYLFVTDPNRAKKSYQPVPLLFNNIWDVPAMNRVAAISSSFWQMIEAMRPYRLRTFAAHTQTLSMLLITDFWSTKTIVEDGHQYWRSYFALNGDHYMMALFMPVYQDAVIGEGIWEATKNQYKQKRRWSWGVSDFPYIVKNSIKHKEIPLFERFLQIFRHFSGIYSWSTSSFVLVLAWVPLLLNRHFQDTVLAHNIALYSSQLLRIAWVGIVINVWISLILLPPRPKNYDWKKSLGMFWMWFLSPPYAIFLSSLPALESQTRLAIGKKLDVFWITPKFRKNAPEVLKNEKPTS